MAHRRISSAEKGKAIDLGIQQPARAARVKAPLPDNSELLRKHSLTLIGRVTNKSVQKVWSLIPFFTEHWKTEFKPIGADLGDGRFQFQFELESDLLAVLEQRPYHYARWMVIIQRWEPTIAPTFPSLIPFWIKVQGLPVHLWTEPIIKVIGEDIGIYEKADITALQARMRVHVDGLLPLIKHSVVEFPNGDEVPATLVYERLDKHCTKCLKLDHELKECLVARAEAKAAKAAQEEERGSIIPQRENEANLSREMSLASVRVEPNNRAREHSKEAPFKIGASHHSTVSGREHVLQHTKALKHREYKPPSKNWDERSSHRRSSQAIERTRREYATSNRSYREATDHRPLPGPPKRSYYREVHRDPTGTRDSTSSSAKITSRSKERGIPQEKEKYPASFPPEILEEARGEARNAMLQYTKCAEPSEREARVERLRQAEESGQLETTALRIARRTLNDNEELQIPELCTSPAEHRSLPIRKGSRNTEREIDEHHSGLSERIPTSLRLGPSPAVMNMEDSPGAQSNDRLPAVQRLGPIQRESVTGEISPLHQSTERVPATLRLGPVLRDSDTEEAQLEQRAPKRKPGRPLGSKNAAKSTKVSSRKPASPKTGPSRRKVAHPKASPIRRKVPSEVNIRSKTSKATKTNRGETSRAGHRQDRSDSASENAPIINMIPRSTKRRVDFRTPPLPAP